MYSRNHKDEGIVLSRKNFGEADGVITIYTRNNGKESFVAKGIRNIKSRKKGHLEVFSQISFSSVSGNGMDILTEAQSLNNFSEIRLDLKKTAVGYFLLETITKVIHDIEKNDEVYDLLLKALNDLNNGENTKQTKDEFVKNVLICLGFWPENLPMNNPDQILEDVLERKLNSTRIGKKLLI